MRTSKLLGALAVAVVTSGVAVPATAQADVQRYQVTTYSYSGGFVAPGGLGYVNTSLTLEVECGFIISGTADLYGTPLTLSDIAADGFSGSFTPLSFVADDGADDGYTFTFNGFWNTNSLHGDVTGPDFPPGNANNWQEDVDLTGSTVSQYRNHGDYVNSVPPAQRSAAAASCIGMPVNSK